MLAYTYLERGKFALLDKPKPVLLDPGDAVVRVTLASICTSDLHIKHGSVPRAVPGVTVGHEMVGVVEETGPDVRTLRPGDRVAVNVETFCGSCFFCRHGWVNNCTDPSGGWALGCRIDGGQAEYVRVPYADQGLTKIPHAVTDRQALFVGTSWPPDTGPLRSPRSHRRTRCSSWAPAPPACALSSASCWKTPGGSSSVSGTPSAWLSSVPTILRCWHWSRRGSGRRSWPTAPTEGRMWCWRWRAARTPSVWPGSAPGPMRW